MTSSCQRSYLEHDAGQIIRCNFNKHNDIVQGTSVSPPGLSQNRPKNYGINCEVDNTNIADLSTEAVKFQTDSEHPHIQCSCQAYSEDEYNVDELKAEDTHSHLLVHHGNFKGCSDNSKEMYKKETGISGRNEQTLETCFGHEELNYGKEENGKCDTDIRFSSHRKSRRTDECNNNEQSADAMINSYTRTLNTTETLSNGRTNVTNSNVYEENTLSSDKDFERDNNSEIVPLKVEKTKVTGIETSSIFNGQNGDANHNIHTSDTYKPATSDKIRVPITDIESLEAKYNESAIKNICISNWVMGIPQFNFPDKCIQSDIANLELQEIKENLSDSANDSTLEGSRPNTPLFESICATPSFKERKARLSIDTISSLNIEDFLLGPYQQSFRSNPKEEPSDCETAKLSKDNMSDFLQSEDAADSWRKPDANESDDPDSDSCSLSTPNSVIEDGDFSRRSSVSFVIDSKSQSQKFKTSTYVPSEESRRSSMSYDHDFVSVTSETSSGSLLEIFLGDSCTPEYQADVNDRSTTVSPFGNQLFYFQHKRKNNMFAVKTAATRLGLTTRRKSYATWREENLNSRGKPIIKKPNITVGDKTDLFTKERVSAIDMALDWIRTELNQMKETDDFLAIQFLDIRRKIHELKLDWSCEYYREMLEDAEDEFNESKMLQRVSDFPEFHSKEKILRNNGMTRMTLGRRKYSIL